VSFDEPADGFHLLPSASTHCSFASVRSMRAAHAAA
jgi:hypothetical protein